MIRVLSVNSSGWRPRRRAGARTGLCNLLKATRCLKLSLLITDNITSSLTFFHKLNPIVIKLLIYSSSSSAGCPKQDLRTRSCVLRSHRYKYINSKSAEKASKLVASWLQVGCKSPESLEQFGNLVATNKQQHFDMLSCVLRIFLKTHKHVGC